MHFKNNPGMELTCNDGFRTEEDDDSMVTWEIGRENHQNLYYIHGAMHVFSDEINIEKYTWINTGKTIKEQVEKSLEKSKYPIFITEGSAEQKQKRINTNSYLGRCFSSLKSITGALFIYGHSLRDEDDHVFNYVNSNRKVKKIFISIYGDPNSPDNNKLLQKVEQWEAQNESKEYRIFDAISAKVWG